jgi:hypothetical protein
MTNTIQIEENRAYRKNLSSQGLIYLGFEELPIKVINLSLSGFLAELSDKQPENRIKDIFNSLQVSPRVDIYLPDMRVAGEAEVARVEAVDGGLLIGIEFRNLSHDIDNLLYNRRAYRKNLSALGEVVIADNDYVFTTQNVSVDGLMVRIARVLDVEVGSRVAFSFKELQVEGEAEVIWVDVDEHTTLLGLRYVHLERDLFPGVPRFVRDQVLSAG